MPYAESHKAVGLVLTPCSLLLTSCSLPLNCPLLRIEISAGTQLKFRRHGKWFPHVRGFGRMRVHFTSMTMLPPVISNAPSTTRQVTGSFRNRKERQMVMTTLNLSMGATRDTSPSCNALK